MFEPVRVTLRLPVGAPVPVEVVDAAASLSQYRMTIRVSGDVWEEIDLVGTFNLDDFARKPGRIVGDGDVQIDLRLADAEVPGLLRRIAGMTPRDGVAELAELPPDSQLLLTEVWFALRVSEALELPPELQGPGREVRSGFSTIWADTDTLVYTPPQADEVVERRVDPADEPWPPLLAAVGDYLRAHDIGFVRHPRADMVSAEIQGHEAAWSLWIHTRESQRQVLVYSINPHTVDEPDRAAVTELIGRLNPKMLIGNFEMSHDGGSFRCRTSLVVNHAPLDGELLAGVIGANLTAMDDGMAALRALLDGVSVEEAAMRFPDPV